MMSVAGKLDGKWLALWRDRRGVVLQETAIIVPLLIMMFLGGYEIARFALLQQKLSRTAMAAADLVTQDTTISVPVVDGILAATSAMMRPFTTGPAQIVIISSVSKTGAAAPKVDWQRTGGGTLTGVTSTLGVAGANATLPTGFIVRSGENVIVAEVFYQFSPTFAADVIPAHTLYHRAMFRPRVISLSTLCASPC